jgi:hypothetical protein
MHLAKNNWLVSSFFPIKRLNLALQSSVHWMGFGNYPGIKTQEVSFKYFTNENTTRSERAQNSPLPAKHTARTTSLSCHLDLMLLA